MFPFDFKQIIISRGREKLQRHLDLLRQEYVRLQNRLAEVEQKYNVATASAAGGGSDNEDNFVSRLLSTIADLFDKELYR